LHDLHDTTETGEPLYASAAEYYRKDMAQDPQLRKKRTRRLWAALAIVAAILALLIVPPLVSMSRYKARITHLMSESLGRPVRLSSVEFRLFPTPGFVLTDLTVQEDPAYGAEPVLHASTVTASIRLLSLWRGRLEISSVSVDEASLNVVRTPEGRWNLDPLFRTAAANSTPEPGAAAPAKTPRALPLPYMEATNSRINFKNGAEKLPFSLVQTDLSFWQEQPGEWRIRLRGQPARTDVSLDLADTGLVRLEAQLHRAPELRLMPVHVDLEWREAQLGQLMRLAIGSDPGWRGDLTGEMHLDGTAEAADVKTRLRATGVHRAEFAPAAPMDFDLSCGFQVHYSHRALDKLACDSPLGDGRIHLAGELPGDAAPPHGSVELDRIPVAAGLDALRTIRSGFGAGLEAAGTVSGKLTYAQPAPEAPAPAAKPHAKASNKAHAAKVHPAPPGPLTGSLTVEGFRLSGAGLSAPIQAAKIVLTPAAVQARTAAQLHAQPHTLPHASVPPAAPPTPRQAALEATVAIPAGAPTPLTVTARFGLAGYELTARGQAGIARAREMAHAAGMAHASMLDALAGDPLTVDLAVAGPWMPDTSPSAAPGSPVSPAADSLSGFITLHNANWRADYLANHVQIAQATLHLVAGDQLWDPVGFSYGPVKGIATLHLPIDCASPQPCLPTFTVRFGDLDASSLQAAILGAHEPGTLLSTLIARLTPANAAPAWPELDGTVSADSLVLGPVTLQAATAALHITATGAEITGLDADLLGGHVHGGGMLTTATGEGKPAYTLEGRFEKLSPAEVGQLVGQRWAGGDFAADGKISLSGFTAQDLAASVKGTVHFDWRRGAVDAGVSDSIPPALARFDRWTADAAIANGVVTLEQNQVQQGSRKRAVEGALTLGEPPKMSFVLPQETQAKR
jgi:hypothetical protein